jgi:hypothetical protein
MALTSTVAFSSQVTSVLVQQTDATKTMNQDMTGGTNLVLTTVEIDAKTNSLPTNETAFVKFYNNAGDTVGTTAPAMVLPVIGGGVAVYQISGGGYAWLTSINMACVTDGGGTAGTTDPTKDVIVRLTGE